MHSSLFVLLCDSSEYTNMLTLTLSLPFRVHPLSLSIHDRRKWRLVSAQVVSCCVSETPTQNRRFTPRKESNLFDYWADMSLLLKNTMLYHSAYFPPLSLLLPQQCSHSLCCVPLMFPFCLFHLCFTSGNSNVSRVGKRIIPRRLLVPLKLIY